MLYLNDGRDDICWSVVIWHLDFSVATWLLLCSTACKCSPPWSRRVFFLAVFFCLFFFSPQHLSLQNNTAGSSPFAPSLSYHRSLNILATTTTSIIKSTPRRCDREAPSPLYHTSTPVNLLLCAIYNIHPCGWLTSQNSSIFPEKQLHDVVVSVMFWAVTD